MAITYLAGDRIQGSSVGGTGGKVGTGAGSFSTANLHYTGNGDQDGDMTVAFWFYRTQSSSSNLTAYNQVSSDNTINANRLQVGTQAAGTWAIYSTSEKLSGGTPPLNTWIHMAVTINGTTWKLYEDGIETDSATDGQATRTNDGLISFMGEGSGAWAQGYMDEACLYDRALSEPEVLSLADGSKKPNDTSLDTSNSLTLYIPMDTVSSGNWYDDKSSTGQAISLTGSPTQITNIVQSERFSVTNVPNGTIFEELDIGKHYMFDGTSTWNEIT